MDVFVTLDFLTVNREEIFASLDVHSRLRKRTRDPSSVIPEKHSLDAIAPTINFIIDAEQADSFCDTFVGR